MNRFLTHNVTIALTLFIAIPCWTGCRQQNSAESDTSADSAANDATMTSSDQGKSSPGQGSGSSIKSQQPNADESESEMKLVAPTEPESTKRPDPPKELLIGSVAPPLDIEHWFSNGGFDKVAEFESGKLYVVEFWATWCGPCLASMPHLVELQEKYRDDGVQIISISNEDPERVETFLDREVPGDSEQTFGELTSNYALTTDPDRSVYDDYMKAASQSGIPCAFIVGKTGEIEWIGHPMGMDEPLESILTDDWDREAFRMQRKKEQEMMKFQMQVRGLLQQQKTDEAVAVIDSKIEEVERDDLPFLLGMRYAVSLSNDSPDAIESLQQLTETIDREEEAQTLNSAAWAVVSRKLSGKSFSDDLVAASWDAIEKANQLLPDNASILDTQARLAWMRGDLDLAIKIQTKAIELATENSRASMEKFLGELKAAKAEESSDSEEASPKEETSPEESEATSGSMEEPEASEDAVVVEAIEEVEEAGQSAAGVDQQR
jgi:thiol-disulfide isomerase/thioredoxin